MLNNPSPSYHKPSNPDCQALDRALKILARLIAGAFLRDHAPVEDKGVSGQDQEQSLDSDDTEIENENLS